MELNLFHDSANLPRLALRLRLRLSALSSRSEQPRSTSAASLHFFPMLSSPRSARQHPGAELSLPPLAAESHSSLRAALCWRRLCLRWLLPEPCAPLPPPPPGCACARDWLNCRLGLPEPASFCAPKLLSTPQAPPSLGGTRPTPRAIDVSLGSCLQSPHPAQSSPLGLGDQPHPTLNCRCKPRFPHWETPVDLEKDRKHATLSSFLFSFFPVSLQQQLSPKCPWGGVELHLLVRCHTNSFSRLLGLAHWF